MNIANKIIAPGALLLSLSLFGCANGISINKKLSLPDDFYVEIQVKMGSEYGEQDNKYILSESSDGDVYMRFGTESEQYVYQKISDEKYIEYKFDTDKGGYKPTMISEAMQEQIDAGNISLENVAVYQASVDSRRSTLDQYLIPYATMGSVFAKGEDATYLGRACETYTADINAFFTRSKLMYAIDKETGLTLYMTNDTTSWFVSTNQINECVAYDTLSRIPEI